MEIMAEGPSLKCTGLTGINGCWGRGGCVAMACLRWGLVPDQVAFGCPLHMGAWNICQQLRLDRHGVGGVQGVPQLFESALIGSCVSPEAIRPLDLSCMSSKTLC